MTPQSQFWYPQKRPKMTDFGSFSGWSEPSVVGYYKKSVSRASQASMSLESLIHGANYGEIMAEMVEASSRYDPWNAPSRTEIFFWRCPGGSGGVRWGPGWSWGWLPPPPPPPYIRGGHRYNTRYILRLLSEQCLGRE